MKAAPEASIRTVEDVVSDTPPGRVIPAGTKGVVHEAYEHPLEGYIAEFVMGDQDFEVTTIYPHQFEVT